MSAWLGFKNAKGTEYETLMNQISESKSLEPILNRCKVLETPNLIFTEKFIKREWRITKTCGVLYFLLNGGEVIYVGATNDQTRMKAHILSRKNGLIDFDTVLYIVLEDSINWALEYFILDNFTFKHNKCAISKRTKLSNEIGVKLEPINKYVYSLYK